METTALSFSITVLRPGNVTERLVISGGRVLIGAGAHCDIRVDGAGAAREHVELEIEGDNVVARALSHTPPPMLGGAPLVATRLEQDAQIAVCGTRITVSVIRDAARRGGGSSARRFATALGVALATIALPAAVYAAFSPSSEGEIGPPPKPIALWEAPVTSCKVEAKDQALHYAKHMRVMGETKRERHPFAVQDGVAAVPAFEMAAACYRGAGRKEEAAKDDEAARALRAVLERDYFAHRVRLDHAIATEDVRSALSEARILRKLTTGLKGPYVDWLAMAERRLDLAQREAEKVAKGLL